MKCPECGHENDEGEEFCLNCGIQLVAPTPPADPAVQSVTAVTESPPEQPPGETPAQPPPPPDPLAEEELKFHSAPLYPIALSLAGSTHPGLSGKNNEDAYLVDGLVYTKHNITLNLLVVADGVGGGEAGEVIAKQAVYRLMSGLWFLMPSWDQMKGFSRLDFWRFASGQFDRFLYNQVVTTNTAIRNFVQAKKLKNSGATLITAAVLCDQTLGRVLIRVLNLGDTRAYLITERGIEQLSTDQVVGGNPTSFLGIFDHVMASQWTKEIWMSDEQIGSMSLLLASDGLWNMLSPEQIANICRVGNNAQTNLNALIPAALSVQIPYGRTLQDPDTKKPVTTGDDNLTAALIQITTKELTV